MAKDRQMNPEVLLIQAQRLRDQGIPIEHINRVLAQVSDGQFGNIPALEEHFALQRHAERGGSPLGDMGRALAHGATFGQSHHLAGLGARVAGHPDPDAVRDEAHQHVQDLNTLNPNVTGLLQTAGAGASLAGGGGLLGRALSRIAR